jgi:hypothetical protein
MTPRDAACMMAAHGHRPPYLDHILLEFRRDDLGRMLEILDLVTGIVRPAVDRA